MFPHGWGEMDYVRGQRYTGQWSMGMKEGCGVMISQGFVSNRYRGQWQRDLKTGKGTIWYQ